MKFFLYLFLTPISNNIRTNYNGENQIPLTINETDISTISEYQIKYKLLRKLQNNKISDLIKLDLINDNNLLCDTNNNISPPNLLKGLDFSFDN